MGVTQGLLPFQVALVEEPELVTAHAAVPVVVELMRAVIPVARYRELAAALGYADWKVVRRHLESLVVLVVSGGEHISDLDVLRADRGLGRLLDTPLSSSTQAKDFLYRFHQGVDGHALTDEEDRSLSSQGKARIRPEGPGCRRWLGSLERSLARCSTSTPEPRRRWMWTPR